MMQDKTNKDAKRETGRKLRLNRETLRELTTEEMRKVVGAGTFCLGCTNGGTGMKF